VEENLHKEPMQIEVQLLAQVVGYALMLMVLLVAKSWLLSVRRANLQHHRLH